MEEWKETIRSRPLCIAALAVIIAVLIVRLIGRNISIGPVYDVNAENVFCEKEINEGEEITLTGKVEDIREKNGSRGTNYTIILDSPEYEGKLLGGKGRYVSVTAKDISGIKIGGKVKAFGRLDYFDHACNSGEFDAYNYYTNRGFLFALKEASVNRYGNDYSKLRNGLYMMRVRLSKMLDNVYDSTDASILKAMLLGVKEEMDPEVKESFQKNGIAHILAISGLHISFLCMTLYGICSKCGFPIWLSVIVSEIFLVAYVLMVGFSPSAFRASVMFSFFLIAGICKRSYDMISAMAAASIIILIINPGYIADSSFLLSFLAILGVGFFYKNYLNNSIVLKKLTKRKSSKSVKGRLYNRFVAGIINSMAVSFFVTMATMPVLLLSYYEIAFYSILLNIVIVPLMSILLICAIASLLLTGTVSALAFIPATVTKAILAIYKYLCRLLENTGMGRVNLGRPKAVVIVVFYLILTFVCLYKYKNKYVVKPLGLICAIALMFLPHWSNSQLHMLDVGQGDCFVYLCENGHVYIFDGGSSSVKNVADRRIIPFLKYYGVKEIEAVFVSHPDIDHMNGITELLMSTGKECIDIKRVCVYSGTLNSGLYKDLTDAADNKADIIGIEAGFELKDSGLSIECLYPLDKTAESEGNDASLVLKLIEGEFEFIEMGDLEADGEQKLLERYNCKELEADVLKVAHHGSSSSSGSDFIAAVSPKVALISAGQNNSYGHPHKETLEKLNESNIAFFCTDISGEIKVEVAPKGRKIKINKYKK